MELKIKGTKSCLERKVDILLSPQTFFLNITNYLNEPPFKQTVVKRDAISQSGLIQGKQEISMAKLFVSSIFLWSELMDFLFRFRCDV